MTDRFWIHAAGDSCFAGWLKRVDVLCQRFLDNDLFEFPEVEHVPWLDLRDSFDDDVRPESYFLRLFQELRAEHGEGTMDRYMARMCKCHRALYPTPVAPIA